MQVDDIRTFVPSKDYQESQDFYAALGFKGETINQDLMIFENGECSFFLQRFYHAGLAKNLMFQLVVKDIEEAYQRVSSLTDNVRFEPVQHESWGKVFMLWGPAGELWQVTELN